VFLDYSFSALNVFEGKDGSIYPASPPMFTRHHVIPHPGFPFRDAGSPSTVTAFSKVAYLFLQHQPLTLPKGIWYLNFINHEVYKV